MGAITSANVEGLTVKTDAGQSVEVHFAPSTRILAAAPGQKSLADAQTISPQALTAGDRVLARGTMDGGVLLASTVVSMKQSEIAQQQEKEQQAWRERGVSGTVKSVDPGADKIVLELHGAGETQPLTVLANKDTQLRRYAADSAKFADTHPGTLNEIKPGDQLRALGSRTSDGSELVAEQIVSGKFRNIACTVIAANAVSGDLTVMDLSSKKPVSLKVTSDAELHSVPPFIAQRLAMRWRSGGNGGPAAAGRARPEMTADSDRGPGEGPPRRAPDIQQMLARLPKVGLSDFHKGDALMIVATEGSAATPPSAVTVLSGVEPILSAAPSASEAAMMLSPWNLGGGAGAAADAAGGP